VRGVFLVVSTFSRRLSRVHRSECPCHEANLLVSYRVFTGDVLQLAAGRKYFEEVSCKMCQWLLHAQDAFVCTQQDNVSCESRLFMMHAVRIALVLLAE
jgi:hypothetical protein